MRIRMMTAGVCALLCSGLLGCLEGPQGTTGPQGKVGAQGPRGGTADFSGDRLRVRYVTGDDGSKQFFDWLDLGTGEPCMYRLVNGAEGEWRCLPGEVFNSRLAYIDPACTEAAMLLHPTDEAKGVVHAQVYSEITEQAEPVKIGEPLSEQPSAAFRPSNGGCMPIDLPGSVTFKYVEFEALPPDFFVLGEVVAY